MSAGESPSRPRSSVTSTPPLSASSDRVVPGATSSSSSALSSSSASSHTDASSSVPQPPVESKLVAHHRRFAHEDSEHPDWIKHKKHIFILSNAGKPIYSRYGDEQMLSPFMASLTALVSFVEDMGDMLKYFTAGKHKFAFLPRGHLLFVCISQTGEPVSHIFNQLNYCHQQLVSILTGRVNSIFTKRAHFDLRTLLGDSEKFLDVLLTRMDHDPSFFLDAIHCLRMDEYLRNTISNIIQTTETPDLLFALLLAKHQLVTLLRPKKYILQPSDIHLLINFVYGSISMRDTESWVPVCLPQFNDQGFLHAYIAFPAKEVCLVLLSTKPESFGEISTCKTAIEHGLLAANALDSISKAMTTPQYSVADLGIPFVWHFVYKSVGTCQFTAPRFTAPYITKQQQKRIFRQYQWLHAAMHKHQARVYYKVTDLETIVGWITAGFELYVVFSPLETKNNCIKACNQILKWIKNEESSLFILNAPVW